MRKLVIIPTYNERENVAAMIETVLALPGEFDLLIIDDLGAEVSNQFTVSTIYNVLNSRISTGLPTVISTNLNQNELNSRYWDRITSRILGEFRPLVFSGSDVRKLKLTE